MFIVHVTPELDSVAKVGGLADVVFGLAHEQVRRGHRVEVFLPHYDVRRTDRLWDERIEWDELRVPFGGETIRCRVFGAWLHGIRVLTIEPHHPRAFFGRSGIYGQPDDAERFAFFCKAVLEFLQVSKRSPEILHAHDWASALAPVLLFETYRSFGMTHPRAVLTIHNVQHQGRTTEAVLRAVHLEPARYMTADRLLDDGRPGVVNLLKGGIVFSNFVTTVSPRYMHEIRHTDLGHGLQPVLARHAQKLGGVLNGVDYDVWNPEVDGALPVRYGPSSIERKYEVKHALRRRLLLREGFKPIVAVVSRLDAQKGVELIKHALLLTLAHDCQFVLLGTSPDPQIQRDFEALKRRYNDNPDCHLELAHDEALAHLVYGGSDILVQPSAFEPCGLTQLIALKYGTVPVVRATGGLADTIFDVNHAAVPQTQRNGFTFEHFDVRGLEYALRRAIALFRNHPVVFREVMLQGMRADHSWAGPAQDYLNIYELVRDR